jgi:hypothetical protein
MIARLLAHFGRQLFDERPLRAKKAAISAKVAF